MKFYLIEPVAMRIARIDQMLNKCEDHLSSTKAFGTEIESLLTQSLLVLMYAEFEQNIKRIVEKKCSSIADSSLRDLCFSCINFVFRGVKLDGITRLLEHFGAMHKKTFEKKTMNNKKAETFYNNIVINRHLVAHAEGTNVTFKDVKQFYEEGHVILDYFNDSLLENNEI